MFPLQVFIQDLSWEDKEIVLRLLFAKMNGAHRAVDTAMKQKRGQVWTRRHSVLHVFMGALIS